LIKPATIESKRADKEKEEDQKDEAPGEPD